MNLPEIKRQIALIFIVLIVVVMIPACSSVSIEYPDDKPAKVEPCVDWIMANKINGDKIIYGMFTPANEAHTWLERGGVCYDNMNNGGFFCEDERYKLFRVVANDAELRTLLIMGVAYKP